MKRLLRYHFRALLRITSTALADIVAFLKVSHGTDEEPRDGAREKNVILPHRRLTEKSDAEIRSRLFFLEPYKGSIHTIALVGSAAYDAQDQGSDIDIVIISKEHAYTALQHVVFDREVAEAVDRRHEPKIEYTLLNPSQTEHLFRRASPFAYSIRYGVIFEDDGYAETLCNTKHPLMFDRKELLTTLYEDILVQYYGSISSLEKKIKKRHCSDSCCMQREACRGLSHANMLAKVLMRMLYIILPSKGYIPLTKTGTIEFTRRVYGEAGVKTVIKAISILRNDVQSINYIDYKLFKFFAAERFREILTIVGPTRKLDDLLKDAVRMIRGEYWEIRDKRMRACMV